LGIVPQIDVFADEGIQVNLAISLHAPTDDVRDRRSCRSTANGNIEELMSACRRYIAKTNRKIFFEYVMLDGVNDRPEHAQALAALMRGPLYHVNIIPYNSTPDAKLGPTGEERMRAFAAILEAKGVSCTIRTPMGRDIAAACGQLRAETQPARQGRLRHP
jgi:23S rRNA (adenine2503-C2)-methyltransferase